MAYSMPKRIYERLFPTATLYELFNGRLPDFRAKAAVRNLARLRIKASYEPHDKNLIRVRAVALTEKHIAYLEVRGYEWKKSKRRKQTKHRPTYPDVVQTILARPRTGDGGGIPLTRGEVAMLFLDGYAGDGPNLFDIRSQGYGEDDDWDGLTVSDVIEDDDTVFVWEKWEPLELWS